MHSTQRNAQPCVGLPPSGALVPPFGGVLRPGPSSPATPCLMQHGIRTCAHTHGNGPHAATAALHCPPKAPSPAALLLCVIAMRARAALPLLFLPFAHRPSHFFHVLMSRITCICCPCTYVIHIFHRQSVSQSRLLSMSKQHMHRRSLAVSIDSHA